jgi:hypothetical protein
VGFVKSSFFKVRRFHDEEDLQQQLIEWHREVNEERPCRATGVIPAVRLTEEAGVSLRSVNRIAEEFPVVHVDDAAEREKRRIGRPSIVEDFRKLVVKILEEKPDLPSLEILRRVRRSGLPGRQDRHNSTPMPISSMA